MTLDGDRIGGSSGDRDRPKDYEIVASLPPNAEFVDGSIVAPGFSGTRIECPCCYFSTTIDLPRWDCKHCGTTLCLALFRGPCGETEGDQDV